MLKRWLEGRATRREIARCQPPVRWLSPVRLRTSHRLCVFVTCDRKYFSEHAVYLLRSIYQHSPGVPVHLHLIDPQEVDLQRVEGIRARWPLHLGCSYEQKGFVELGESFRTYCASIRFVRAYQMLCRSRLHLLCLDADTLVRRDLRLLLPALGDAELSLRTRFEQQRDELKIAVGTVFLRNCPRTRQYAGKVAVDIARELAAPTPTWFLDQRILFHRYNENPEAIRLVDLPHEYADWDFREDSSIWAGKGPRKWENERFVTLRHVFEKQEQSDAMPPPAVRADP